MFAGVDQGPGHGLFLEQVHRLDEDQADDRDQEDHSEHFVKGIGFFHPHHIDAQAFKAAQPFRDDSAHHRIGGGDAQSREELFRGGGELHIAEDLPVGSAHSPHHVDKVGVSGGKAAEQTDGHGEEAGDDNEYHLGQDSIAQPEYQQRRDCHSGDSLGEDQQGIDGFPYHPELIHEEGYHKGEDHSGAQTQEGLRERDPGMGHKGREILHKGGYYIRGRGQHEFGHHSQIGTELPDCQQYGNEDSRCQLTGDTWMSSCQW